MSIKDLNDKRGCEYPPLLNILKKFYTKWCKLLLLFLAAIFFALQYYFPISFVAFVPLFLLLDKITIKTSVLWGFIYGVLSYGLYGLWLLNLGTVAFFGAIFLCGVQWAFVMLILKTLNLFIYNYDYITKRILKISNKDPFLRQEINTTKIIYAVLPILYSLALTIFEWIKTKGFLGVSYGNLGYSVYKLIYLIQIADVGGVFFVSFLLYMSSAAIYFVISSFKKTTNLLSKTSKTETPFINNSNKFNKFDAPTKLKNDPKDSPMIKNSRGNKNTFNKDYTFTQKIDTHKIITSSLHNNKISLSIIIPPAVFLLLLIASIIYSIIKVNCTDNYYKNRPTINICAVQNNSDPWRDGIDVYEKDVNTLITLSSEALQKDPNIKLIVWPETAVIPSIIDNYKKNSERGYLIRRLLNFIDEQNCNFVVGNFHVIKPLYDDSNTSIKKDNNSNGTPLKNNSNAVIDNKYFNSAFLFEPGKNVLPPNPYIYSKVHLVPFTETFPLGKYFPHFYMWLTDGDTHLWDAGDKRNIFSLGDFNFATPICFEDTFGCDCKEFVNNGARAFISLGNDSWSKSSFAQELHLSMAIFRSVENHIPSVRASASGVSCLVDWAGRVKNKLQEFSKGYLICKVPY